jgi:hypothetical protein
MRLGWRSVAEMEARMPFREYVEWIAFFNSEQQQPARHRPQSNSGSGWRNQLKFMKAFGALRRLGG